MSELIDREALKPKIHYTDDYYETPYVEWDDILEQPTIAAPRWHRVEEPPKEAGEYIVAYHPCWWDDVKTQVTEVGIDSFRGKASWAKRKHQRVTHWMEKPEPPQEDA